MENLLSKKQEKIIKEISVGLTGKYSRGNHGKNRKQHKQPEIALSQIYLLVDTSILPFHQSLYQVKKFRKMLVQTHFAHGKKCW